MGFRTGWPESFLAALKFYSSTLCQLVRHLGLFRIRFCSKWERARSLKKIEVSLSHVKLRGRPGKAGVAVLSHKTFRDTSSFQKTASPLRPKVMTLSPPSTPCSKQHVGEWTRIERAKCKLPSAFKKAVTWHFHTTFNWLWLGHVTGHLAGSAGENVTVDLRVVSLSPPWAWSVLN